MATRFVNKVIGEQRLGQPLPEIGIWAGAGLTTGYCLRRVEEDQAGVTLVPTVEPGSPLGPPEPLEERTDVVAAELRQGVGDHVLTDDETMVAALDRIIASEIERRLDHWRDSIDEPARAELSEYITWWVVKGYALRVAEAAIGALQ